MELVFNFLLLFLSLLNFLPLWKANGWLVRVWDYPKKQIFFLQCLLLVIYLMQYRITANWEILNVALTIGSIGFSIYRIYPYTRVASKQLKKSSTTAKTLSILVSNVEMKNTDYEKLIRLIKTERPDIILLLETDEKWKNALKGLEDTYTHNCLLPLDNTYGMLFYSKLQLDVCNYKYLVHGEIPSIETILNFNGTKMKLYGIHPEPPFPTQSKDTVERDAEILLVAKKIEKENIPIIVAGDLNDVAWSYTTRLFQKVSGMLDPRIGRGFFSTFHAKYFWARWPLDHIFVSSHFNLVSLKRLSEIGSDHFPIYAEFTLKGNIENEQVESVTAEEKQVVKEKIEEGF